MPRGRRSSPAAGPVEVSMLAPAEVEATPQMLYRSVAQIDPAGLRVEFKWLDPDAMNEMIRNADSDSDFHQRPLSTRDVNRWRLLIESERFVHFLPNGPLCFDPAGMLLNGKHRLTAGAGQERKLGFMIVRGVPRWMFKHFDTPRQRTVQDVFIQAGRMTKAQTGATVRLALRYEEFLYGLRKPIGWKDWTRVRDEHADLDDFLGRREDLADLYIAATRASVKTRLIISSLMVFRFYQQVAWPEGQDVFMKFWDGLVDGAMLAKGNAALTLREWARDSYEMAERITAKREVHLVLLLRAFGQFAKGSQLHRLDNWAYGWPMGMPYHPDGHEVAIKNVREHLAHLDRAAG